MRRFGFQGYLFFGALTGFAALLSSIFLIRELGIPDANIVDVVTVREGAFYALHPLYALGGYGLIMLEFILAYLVPLATKHGVPGFAPNMSKGVAQIYLVQWVTITLLSPLLVAIANIWVNIGVAFSVLLISCARGMTLKKTKPNSRQGAEYHKWRPPIRLLKPLRRRFKQVDDIDV